MHPLVKLAVVGTGRTGEEPLSGSPVDALIAALPAGEGLKGSREWRLLLTAGAWAVYRQAGLAPEVGPEAPAPSPAEPRPYASKAAEDLLQEFLSTNERECLEAAFLRLTTVGQVLPPALLPQVLSKDAAIRKAARPVLGARGRWLQSQNPEWADASAPVTVAPTETLDTLQKAWEEGDSSERVLALKKIRATDAAAGRAALAAVWKQEKAEFKADALDAMSIGLEPEDEALLEQALTDRGQSVREKAATLLAALPDAAWLGRMKARAAALLTYDATATSKLQLKLPDTFPADWKKDGVIERRPPSLTLVGDKGWWALQVLSAAPVRAWEEIVGLPFPALVQALATDEYAIAEGWSRAALARSATDSEAILALWLWWKRVWLAAKTRNVGADHGLTTWLGPLVPYLPPADAEAQLLSALAPDWDTRQEALAWTMLRQVPEVSSTVADRIVAVLNSLAAQSAQRLTRSAHLTSLPELAWKWPEARLADALKLVEDLKQVTANHYSVVYYLERFAQVLRHRERIVQTIPLS